MEPLPEQRAYVDAVDRWRISLGLGDAGLCRLIGQHKSDWSRIRSFQRHPTRLFHARAVAKAAEPYQTHLRALWAVYQGALDRQLELVEA